jgi:arsenate reductase-like glutaredoxin family protein
MAKIKLNNVRLSFPSLFRKAEFQGNAGKYEATFLLNKKTHADTIAEIEKQIEVGIKENFKGKKIPADKLCLKDGDEFDYDGYAGCMSFKASNGKRPMVIDKDKSQLTEDDERVYAGCYVNAVVELWFQDNQYGKRVNANLLGVQFFKDGEPFGDGVTASEDDFDAFDDEDDASDLV